MERGAASGEEIRISSREADFDLRGAQNAPDHAGVSHRGEAGNAGPPRHERRYSNARYEAAGDTAAQNSQPETPSNQGGALYDQPLPQEAAGDGAAQPQQGQAAETQPPLGNEAPASREAPAHRGQPERPHIQRGTRYQQKFQQEAAQAPPVSDGQAEQPPPATGDGDSRPSKLAFAEDELPPAASGRKLAQAKQKAERAAEKLEAAEARLPSYRKLRMETQSDPNTGKAKKRLRLEKEVKPQAAHIKGPLPLRPVKAGANTAIGYAHRKVYQVEEENVGTKAAHRAELAAESGLRAAYHAHKTAPYRKVSQMQKKVTNTSAKAAYQQALHDHPELKKNALAGLWQKQKLKRQYAKAAREAKRAGKAAKKTAVTTERIASQVGAFIKRHPLLFGGIALGLLLIFLITSVFSSCSNMGASTLGGILASSYLAEDKDVDDAELYYTEWETDLQMEIDRAEIDHPGYDEYRYQVDDIGHDPYELMGFLSAVYQNFTYAQVQGVLREIFEEQYTLEFIEEVEIRYRTETRTDPETGDSYDVEVPYEWYILNIKLTTRSFSDLIAARMDAEQKEIHDITLLTKGNRQYVANVFGDTNWLPYVTSNYGYRLHPITGAKDYHKGVDIGLPQGTEILAGHDGVVTQAGDAGGYGLIVALEGEAAESHTLTTKYAHCSELLVSVGQEVKKGDVIARVGNTGDSTGPHLHLEVLMDGQYLNPLYFADTGDDGSGSVPPGTPGGVEIPDYPGEPMDDPTYAALMAEAQTHIGKPYVFGAKGPDAFDCSGFVCWSLSESGVRDIATNAQGLFNASTPVSRENARPGDLIFFHSTYSTANTVTHVGIYVGNGQMLHAGKPIQYASIDTAYWTEHFYAFGRID